MSNSTQKISTNLQNKNISSNREQLKTIMYNLLGRINANELTPEETEAYLNLFSSDMDLKYYTMGWHVYSMLDKKQ